MPLVQMKDILMKANQENYGVGAFSVANMEMVMGAIKAKRRIACSTYSTNCGSSFESFANSSDWSFDGCAAKKRLFQ